MVHNLWIILFQAKSVSHRKVSTCLKRGIIPSRLSFGVGTAEVSQEGHSERKLFLKREIENKLMPLAGSYRNFSNRNARQVYKKDRRNWANYSERASKA